MTEPRVSGRAARKSTALVGAVITLLAMWQAYRGRQTPAFILGGSAGVLLMIALTSERLSMRFHLAWMALAGVLGWINSRILLSAMYFLVMTPIGWGRRVLGADPLNRRRPQQESYWISRKTTRPPSEQFERLF